MNIEHSLLAWLYKARNHNIFTDRLIVTIKEHSLACIYVQNHFDNVDIKLGISTADSLSGVS